MRITKDPQVRKHEIVETAMIIFEENGIQKTSMSEIAKRAGVAKGLLYYYFTSKDALVSEVIDQFSKGVNEYISEIMKNENYSFYDKLSHIINFFFSTIVERTASMSISMVNQGTFELIRTKLSDVAILHAKELVLSGKKEGIISIEYPELVVKMLIKGIADLYMDGETNPEVLTVLIEQALGIPKGRIGIKLHPHVKAE
ncbi:MAG: TetR/AcrR family transcriptional regulator [Clostridiaceae bacterium]